jgi:hypothetical protein
MTAYQVYEQAIKPLSAEEKLVVARLIMDEVVPHPAPQPSVRQSEQTTMPPSQFGAGRDLLAGIDVDELLAVSIDEVFADYMPEEADAAHH